MSGKFLTTDSHQSILIIWYKLLIDKFLDKYNLLKWTPEELESYNILLCVCDRSQEKKVDIFKIKLRVRAERASTQYIALSLFCKKTCVQIHA